jgi:hypothetical protein
MRILKVRIISDREEEGKYLDVAVPITGRRVAAEEGNIAFRIT